MNFNQLISLDHCTAAFLNMIAGTRKVIIYPICALVAYCHSKAGQTQYCFSIIYCFPWASCFSLMHYPLKGGSRRSNLSVFDPASTYPAWVTLPGTTLSTTKFFTETRKLPHYIKVNITKGHNVEPFLIELKKVRKYTAQWRTALTVYIILSEINYVTYISVMFSPNRFLGSMKVPDWFCYIFINFTVCTLHGKWTPA